jgi:hypothetical protein
MSNLIPSGSSGLIYTNETLTGDPRCAALFTGGEFAVPNPAAKFPSAGFVLGTGNTNKLNYQDGSQVSTNFGLPGDAQINTSDFTSFDACFIEFEFQCGDNINGGNLSIDYVFASDEYKEKVDENLGYADEFGLFLNDVNIATVPTTGEPVSIYSVNHLTNTEYFVHNNPRPGQAAFVNFEPDGFTKGLKAIGPIISGWNTMKIGIVDVNDGFLDSWVFLEGGAAFQCIPAPTPFPRNQQANITPEIPNSSKPLTLPPDQPSSTSVSSTIKGAKGGERRRDPKSTKAPGNSAEGSEAPKTTSKAPGNSVKESKVSKTSKAPRNSTEGSKAPKTSKASGNSVKESKVSKTSKAPRNSTEGSKAPKTSKASGKSVKESKAPKTSKAPRNDSEGSKAPKTSKAPGNSVKESKAPKTSKAPRNDSEGSKAPKTSKAPGNSVKERSKAPKTSKAPRNDSEGSKAPKTTSKAPRNDSEGSKAPETSKDSKAPVNGVEGSKAPKTSKAPGNSGEGSKDPSGEGSKDPKAPVNDSMGSNAPKATNGTESPSSIIFQNTTKAPSSSPTTTQDDRSPDISSVKSSESSASGIGMAVSTVFVLLSAIFLNSRC